MELLKQWDEDEDGCISATEFRQGCRVLLLDAASESACVELGGRPWAARGARAWDGASAMREPLRSVAFNLGLERWAADQIERLQRLPFVDFPGL